MAASPPELTQLLIDHLPNQIVWKDIDGVYLGCNQAFAKVVGLDNADQIVGMTDYDFNRDPSMAESYRQWDKKVLESGEPLWDLLEEYANADGSDGFVLTSKVPIRDSDGAIIGVLGLCVDVTARVKSERALARSEHRLRLTTEKAGVAVWEYDVMWRSPKHDQLYGFDGIEAWNKEFFLSATHPEDRDFVNGLIQSSLSPGGIDHYSFDFRVIWPDQSVHWLSVTAEVTERDQAGVATKVCGCLVDITARKTAEEALRHREAALSEAQALAHLAIWNYDFSTDTLDCSEEMYRIGGISPAEPISKELILSRLHPDDRPIYKQGIAELKAHGRADCKLRLLRPHGEVRWISCRGRADFTAQDLPTRYYGTILDITEQVERDKEKVQLEEQFHHAQMMEAIGRLAGGVAHDFNNLLTIINSYAELSQQRLGEAHDVYPDIGEILQAGRQAASLTRQLLAFSRKQPMEIQFLEINEVIIRVSKMLGRLIGEDIDLRTKLAPDLSLIRADPSQMEQILLYLAVNTRDAMPKGGTLTIETTQSKSTENTEDWVVLTVTDTGTGMSAEVLEQCFDPFFTTKEKDRGTGLGLSTVYGVLEQSGGHISVSSEPGRGTSFRISLLAAGDENGKSDSEQIPTPAYGRETVLLVEDDRAVRRLLQRSLSTLGYCVIATADGEEGLREFKAHQESIALVLTDVVMPGMSGKEMVDRIYELAPTTRVLFMSGCAESIIAHDGILDDGVQFLPKPFSLANLQSKVWSALNGHE